VFKGRWKKEKKYDMPTCLHLPLFLGEMLVLEFPRSAFYL
jgi:hypothetical protein